MFDLVGIRWLGGLNTLGNSKVDIARQKQTLFQDQDTMSPNGKCICSGKLAVNVPVGPL